MGGNKKYLSLLLAFVGTGTVFGGASYVAVKGIDYLLSSDKKSGGDVAAEKGLDPKSASARAPASLKGTSGFGRFFSGAASAPAGESAGSEDAATAAAIKVDNSGSGANFMVGSVTPQRSGFIAGSPPPERSPDPKGTSNSTNTATSTATPTFAGGPTSTNGGVSAGVTSPTTTTPPAIITPPGLAPAPAIGATAGGMSGIVTADGHKVSVTLGAPLSGVNSTTSDGHKVILGVQSAGF